MSTSTQEIIIRVEVTHTPNEFGTPAHIRVTGHTNEGAFTIRKIIGLRTDKIEKKLEEAKAIFALLVGLPVKVITRAPTRPGKPGARVVNHNTLPDWARGDWTKVKPH